MPLRRSASALDEKGLGNGLSSFDGKMRLLCVLESECLPHQWCHPPQAQLLKDRPENLARSPSRY